MAKETDGPDVTSLGAAPDSQGLNSITDSIREEVLARQMKVMQAAVADAQENDEQKTLINGMTPEAFNAYMREEENKEKIRQALENEKVQSKLNEVEVEGHKKVREAHADSYQDITWQKVDGNDNARSNEIKDQEGNTIVTLTETTHKQNPVAVQLSDGSTKNIDSYRTVDFPTKLENGKGPLHLSMAVKDPSGKNISADKALYFSAHYDEQGKLTEISSPQPVKFAGKGDDAIGYIERDGQIYTLAITQGQYKEMAQEVAKNNGMAFDLSPPMEKAAPDVAMSQEREEGLARQNASPNLDPIDPQQQIPSPSPSSTQPNRPPPPLRQSLPLDDDDLIPIERQPTTSERLYDILQDAGVTPNERDNRAVEILSNLPEGVARQHTNRITQNMFQALTIITDAHKDKLLPDHVQQLSNAVAEGMEPVMKQQFTKLSQRLQNQVQQQQPVAANADITQNVINQESQSSVVNVAPQINKTFAEAGIQPDSSDRALINLIKSNVVDLQNSGSNDSKNQQALVGNVQTLINRNEELKPHAREIVEIVQNAAPEGKKDQLKSQFEEVVQNYERQSQPLKSIEEIQRELQEMLREAEPTPQPLQQDVTNAELPPPLMNLQGKPQVVSFNDPVQDIPSGLNQDAAAAIGPNTGQVKTTPELKKEVAQTIGNSADPVKPEEAPGQQNTPSKDDDPNKGKPAQVADTVPGAIPEAPPFENWQAAQNKKKPAEVETEKKDPVNPDISKPQQGVDPGQGKGDELKSSSKVTPINKETPPASLSDQGSMPDLEPLPKRTAHTKNEPKNDPQKPPAPNLGGKPADQPGRGKLLADIRNQDNKSKLKKTEPIEKKSPEQETHANLMANVDKHKEKGQVAHKEEHDFSNLGDNDEAIKKLANIIKTGDQEKVQTAVKSINENDWLEEKQNIYKQAYNVAMDYAKKQPRNVQMKIHPAASKIVEEAGMHPFTHVDKVMENAKAAAKGKGKGRE